MDPNQMNRQNMSNMGGMGMNNQGQPPAGGVLGNCRISQILGALRLNPGRAVPAGVKPPGLLVRMKE